MIKNAVRIEGNRISYLVPVEPDPKRPDQEPWAWVQGLQLTRSIADKDCPAACSDPAITRTTFQGEALLLTTCDGVTDHLSLEKIKEIVISCYQKEDDRYVLKPGVNPAEEPTQHRNPLTEPTPSIDRNITLALASSSLIIIHTTSKI